MLRYIRQCVPPLAIGFLLCIGSLQILTSPARATEYTDTQGHWAQEVIEKWSDSGILSGYADGTFRPNAPVTRAQLSTVLYRIWGAEPVEGGFAFSDLPQDMWCYNALNTMSMYGVALNTGGRILPDEPLTREEAFYMIAKAFSIGTDQDVRSDEMQNRIPDWHDVSDRYTSRLKMMVYDHYVNGSADGRLNPERGITRAEVMKVIDNMIDVYISEPGTYNVHYRQNTLVTCGGVTLNQIMPPQNYVHPRYTGNTYTYLFGSEASQGGVTFRNGMDGTGSATFSVYTTGTGDPYWNTEGKCSIRKSIRSNSTYPFPDTRFAGGRGTLFFPYVITTPEQFQLLAEFQDDKLSRPCFQLTCDIDLGALSAPVCPNATVKANLDGGNHKVTYQMADVTLEYPEGGLFFDWVGNIQNLILEGTAEATFAEGLTKSQPMPLLFGGFSGSLTGNAENCVTRMNITVRSRGNNILDLDVGGLVGNVMSAEFTNCRSEGSVHAVISSPDASVHAGGILGCGTSLGPLHQGADFLSCGAAGSVTAQGGEHANAGGIVGLLTYGQVNGGSRVDDWAEWNLGSLENCWSTAEVFASAASFQAEAGGLVGQLNAGTVKSCWASPTVSLSGGTFQDLGAIAASCRARASISDCWADVSHVATGGSLHAGGITGPLESSVSNCYVIGASKFGKSNAITFESWNSGTVSSCADFTDSTAKGPFLRDCGWDFTKIWDASGAYPILRGCDKALQTAALA